MSTRNERIIRRHGHPRTSRPVSGAANGEGISPSTPAADVVAHAAEFEHDAVHRGVAAAVRPDLGDMSMQAPAGPVSGHAKRSKSGPARRATKPTPSTTTAAKLNHAADLFRSKSCVVSVGKSSIAGIHIHDAGVLHFAATPKVHGKVPGHHEAVLQLGDFALAVRRVRGCGLALGKLLRRVRGLEDGDRPGVGLELDDDDEYDSDDDAAELVEEGTQQACSLLDSDSLEPRRAGAGLLLWLSATGRGLSYWSEQSAAMVTRRSATVLQSSNDVDTHLLCWTVLRRMADSPEPHLKRPAQELALNPEFSRCSLKLRSTGPASAEALREVISRTVESTRR